MSGHTLLRYRRGIAAVLLGALVSPAAALSGGYTQDWLRTHSGFWGVGVGIDSNGNVYTTGASPNLPENGYRHDIYTIKYGPDGSQLWRRTYNNTDDATNQDDDPSWLVVDAADNIVVVGSTHTNATGNEAVLLKYDGGGALLWERLFGGPGVTADYGFFVATDPAGNIYAAGRTFGENWDFLTVKYDASGNRQWLRSRGFGGPDEPVALAVAEDGRVLVTGENWNQRVVTVVYDANGNELWSDVLDEPDPGPIYSAGHGLFDGAGNALVTGMKGGTVFLAKYDPAGQRLFERLYLGGTVNRSRVDSRDNVLITGESSSYDRYLLKVDPAGNTLWTAFGDPAGEGVGIDLAVLPNDDVVVAGTTSFVVWTLAGYDAGGTEQWELTVDPGGFTNWPRMLAVGPGQIIAVTGSGPIVTARFRPPDATGVDAIGTVAAGLEARPNPFRPVTDITYNVPRAGKVGLAIHDVAGRVVTTLVDAERPAGTYSVRWDGRGASGAPVASGVYVIRLEAGETSRTRKLTLLR